MSTEDEKLLSGVNHNTEILQKLRGDLGKNNSSKAFGGIFAIVAVLGALAAIFLPIQSTIEQLGDDMSKLEEKVSPLNAEISAIKQRFEKVQAQLDANIKINEATLRATDYKASDIKSEIHGIFPRLNRIERQVAELLAVLRHSNFTIREDK